MPTWYLTPGLVSYLAGAENLRGASHSSKYRQASRRECLPKTDCVDGQTSFALPGFDYWVSRYVASYDHPSSRGVFGWNRL